MSKGLKETKDREDTLPPTYNYDGPYWNWVFSGFDDEGKEFDDPHFWEFNQSCVAWDILKGKIEGDPRRFRRDTWIWLKNIFGLEKTDVLPASLKTGFIVVDEELEKFIKERREARFEMQEGKKWQQEQEKKRQRDTPTKETNEESTDGILTSNINKRHKLAAVWLNKLRK